MSNTLGNTKCIQEANFKKDTLSVLFNLHLLSNLINYILLIFTTVFYCLDVNLQKPGGNEQDIRIL